MNFYIHIPFCHSKCAYCAFLSHCDITREDEYVAALCSEISDSPPLSSLVGGQGHSPHLRHPELTKNPGLDSRLRGNDRGALDCTKVETIYFGGGTPSLIKTENIAKIIETITTRPRLVNDAEVTLECNPEDINENKLKKWKSAGVNRLSIGIQTFDDKVRKRMGRSLTAKRAIERVKLAQKYFNNVGIDLISGLPGDSFDSLEARSLFLETVDHVSLYDLETNNNSVIGKNPGSFDLPNEKRSTEMLVSTWDILASLGFEQYEVSNFVKNGKYCRHNLNFWQGQDYQGFGLGAVSRHDNKITTNTSDFAFYLTGKHKEGIKTMSISEKNRFLLISAMRLNKPFKKELKTACGNTNIPAELRELGLVTADHTLTQKGKLLYNQVVDRLTY